MNIITKICIVLLALLGVCVSVAVPRTFITQENYRQLYLQEKGQRELAETGKNNADLAELSGDQEILRLEDDLSRVRSDLDTEQQAHADSVRRLQTQLTALEETVKTLTVQVGNLAAGVTRVEQGRAIVTEQLNLALERSSRQQDELTATGNDLAAADAQNERLNGTVRLLKERLTQLKEQYDRLAATASVADVQSVAEPTAPATAGLQVTGTVTAVRNDMASINIGSVKGIEKDMTLFIYRGDHFIAHLRIIDVDDSESTGQVFDPREGATPQDGDKVTTSLR